MAPTKKATKTRRRALGAVARGDLSMWNISLVLSPQEQLATGIRRLAAVPAILARGTLS